MPDPLDELRRLRDSLRDSLANEPAAHLKLSAFERREREQVLQRIESTLQRFEGLRRRSTSNDQ
jgi:hypothetical protein